MTTPLVLNEPTGSDINLGKFYVSDRDGGTSASDPLVAVTGEVVDAGERVVQVLPPSVEYW